MNRKMYLLAFVAKHTTLIMSTLLITVSSFIIAEPDRPVRPPKHVLKTETRKTSLSSEPSFVTNDPIRFTLEANKRQVHVGEEVELTVTADLLNISSKLMFFLEGSNAFSLKLITPEGFVRTDGNDTGIMEDVLSYPSRPTATYHIRGKFNSTTAGTCFRLIRSERNPTVQSRYVQKANLCYAYQASGNSEAISTNKITSPSSAYILLDEIGTGNARLSSISSPQTNTPITRNADTGGFSVCIEGENGSGNRTPGSDTQAQGGQNVGGFGNSSEYMTYTIAGVPSASTYTLHLFYVSGDSQAGFGIVINSGSAQTVIAPSTARWTGPYVETTTPVSLNAGTNTIRLQGSGQGSFVIDRLCVDGGSGGPTGSSLSISTTQQTVGSGAGDISESVTASNVTWSATSSDGSWLTASPASAGNGTTPVTVHYGANTGNSARSATITFSGQGVASQVLTVNQAAVTTGGFSVCIEGENGSGNRTPGSDTQAQGGQNVGGFGNSGEYMAYTIAGVPSASTYTLHLFYVSGDSQAGFGIVINSGSAQTVIAPSTARWTGPYVETTTPVSLNAGTNTIRLQGSGQGSFVIDRLCVDGGSGGPTGSSLSISTTQQTVGSGAGDISESVTASNVTWSATSSDGSWLTASPASAGNGTTPVTVHYGANTGNSARSATITFSGQGVASQTLTVTQNPATVSNTTGKFIYGEYPILGFFELELYQQGTDWYIRDKTANYSDARTRYFTVDKKFVGHTLNGYNLGHRAGIYSIEATRYSGNDYPTQDNDPNHTQGLEAAAAQVIITGDLDEPNEIATPSTFVLSTNFAEHYSTKLPVFQSIVGKLSGSTKYTQNETLNDIYNHGANFVRPQDNEGDPSKLVDIDGNPYNGISQAAFQSLSDAQLQSDAQQHGGSRIYLLDFEDSTNWPIHLEDATLVKLYTYVKFILQYHPQSLAADYYRNMISNKAYIYENNPTPISPYYTRFADQWTNPESAILDTYRSFYHPGEGHNVSLRDLYGITTLDCYVHNRVTETWQYPLYHLYSIIHDARIARKVTSSATTPIKTLFYIWPGSDSDAPAKLFQHIPGGTAWQTVRRYAANSWMETMVQLSFLVGDGYAPFHDQLPSSDDPTKINHDANGNEGWIPDAGSNTPPPFDNYPGGSLPGYPREPQHYVEYAKLGEYKLKQVDDILGGGYADDCQYSLDGGNTWLNTEGESAVDYRAKYNQPIVLKKVIGNNKALVWAVSPFSDASEHKTIKAKISDDWIVDITTTGKWPSTYRFER